MDEQRIHHLLQQISKLLENDATTLMENVDNLISTTAIDVVNRFNLTSLDAETTQAFTSAIQAFFTCCSAARFHEYLNDEIREDLDNKPISVFWMIFLMMR